jgi:hypothetical protein
MMAEQNRSYSLGMSGDDVRAWLASLPPMEADHCDRCGHTEGPFVEEPDGNPLGKPRPYCHLCVVRSQAMDEWERLLLTDLFSAALKAMCTGSDGIMVKSIGQAARDAGNRLLAEWGERGGS